MGAPMRTPWRPLIPGHGTSLDSPPQGVGQWNRPTLGVRRGRLHSGGRGIIASSLVSSPITTVVIFYNYLFYNDKF